MTHGGDQPAGSAPFVGRADQLDRVADAVKAARAASPQVLVVQGEAGIGKTAFLRRCLAEASDLVVLEAGADEAEATLDFGVVSQLLSRAAVVSGGPPRQPPRDRRPAGSPFAVGAELLGMLGGLQDRGPVFLLLDDAQWIDSASAGALLFALRRLHGDRVCVLIAARPDGVAQDGSSWSRLLNDAERVQRLTLSGLDGGEVGQLASSLGHAPLTPAAAERLARHTRGHPLHLKALLSELADEVLASEEGPLPAPRSFAATVLVRLAGISNEAQELVAAAAVAGTRCPAILAGTAAGLDDPLVALDEACAAELLTLAPAQVPAEVTFPHPLVRAAVYDDLSLTRRRQLHLACARLTPEPAALAHRAAASPGADDALAGELTDAGEAEVANGRLTAAIEHLLLASRVAATGSIREAALLRAVDTLGIAGDVPRAQALRGAVAACRDSPRRSFSLGTLAASAGRLDEAIVALQAVTERPDFAAAPELSGAVISSLAIICAYAGDGPAAIDWAHRALDGESPPATVAVTARQALALGLGVSGRPGDGVTVLGAVSASRIAPEPFEAELLATRGNLKLRAGDLLGAVDDLSAVIAWSRSGSMPRSLANAHCSLAEAEYRLGRWDEGQTHADLAVLLAEGSDQFWELPFAHAVASFFSAGRGEWRAAGEHVSAAARAASVGPLPLGDYHAGIARANLASAHRDWVAVLAALDELRARTAGISAAAVGHHAWVLEAEALLGAGQVQAAAAVLKRFDDVLLHGAGPALEVDVWRLRAVLAQACGHSGQARDAFVAGQAAAQRADSLLAEATLERAYAHFLRKTGRRGPATARLQVARGLFERLRAAPLVQRCDAELAAGGIRALAAGSDGHGLTPREQAVARLVASGKSNREVGEELYLSTKAIEYHLANIFTKVGIRSRRQLAERLEHADTGGTS